ncbi:MAG: hypothetical protein WAK54_20765 [Bradyrhizobium sp.]
MAIAVVPTAIATAAVSEPVLARGGAPNIMDSPGYQRRLQESRQQLPPTGAPASPHRHQPRHRHRH